MPRSPSYQGSLVPKQSSFDGVGRGSFPWPSLDRAWAGCQAIRPRTAGVSRGGAFRASSSGATWFPIHLPGSRLAYLVVCCTISWAILQAVMVPYQCFHANLVDWSLILRWLEAFDIISDTICHCIYLEPTLSHFDFKINQVLPICMSESSFIHIVTYLVNNWNNIM
jgi:hypothetical protein